MPWPSNIPLSGGDFSNKNTFFSTSTGTTPSIATNGTSDLITFTGRGFVSEINIVITNASGGSGGVTAIGAEVVIDGIRTIPLYALNGTTVFFPTVAGQGTSFSTTPASTTVSTLRTSTPIVFKSSAVIRLKNYNASAQTATFAIVAAALM